MTERNPDIRRLKSMQAEIGCVLLTIAGALIVQSSTFTFIVLCFNAILWALMLQEVGRDLAAIRFGAMEKSTSKRRRMK
jgi:hypothetical protein